MDRNPTYRPGKRYNPKVCPFLRKMARVLYETTDVPTDEIAARVGTNSRTLARWAREHGWTLRPWGQRGDTLPR